MGQRSGIPRLRDGFRVLGIVLAALTAGCAGGRPGLVRGGGWEVVFDSPAPDDPEDDSLYLELVDGDALEEGFVEIAVQLHRMTPRLLRASGAVAFRVEDLDGSGEGARRGRAGSGSGVVVDGAGGVPLAYREWDEGWYFERCRSDVEYEVVDRAVAEAGPATRVEYEVGAEAMGLVGRLLTGSCEGARDTGRLLVLRFELLQPGTVVFDVDPDGRTGFDATAGRDMDYGRTYGGTLTIRRIR